MACVYNVAAACKYMDIEILHNRFKRTIVFFMHEEYTNHASIPHLLQRTDLQGLVQTEILRLQFDYKHYHLLLMTQLLLILLQLRKTAPYSNKLVSHV